MKGRNTSVSVAPLFVQVLLSAHKPTQAKAFPTPDSYRVGFTLSSQCSNLSEPQLRFKDLCQDKTIYVLDQKKD